LLLLLLPGFWLELTGGEWERAKLLQLLVSCWCRGVVAAAWSHGGSPPLVLGPEVLRHLLLGGPRHGVHASKPAPGEGVGCGSWWWQGWCQ
jgi:hypothetical protein